MKTKIIKEFTRKDLHQHFEVPFDVTEDVDVIILGFKVVSDKPADLIELGLRDPEKMRGWTGVVRSEVVITKEYATPGYLAGDLIPGEWCFLISTYDVPENGCRVELTVELKMKKYRWFKGDPHFHTDHSDGNRNISDSLIECRRNGLDFVVFADHNTTTQNNLLPTDKYIIVIPGMELTTPLGHSNLSGLKQPVKDFRCTDKKDVFDKFEETRSNGGFIGINHPIRVDPEDFNWKWGFDLPIDWIEVWNGSWSPRNKNALNWWHEQLCSEKRIPIVSGTDNHRIQRFKTHELGFTHVFADSIDKISILEAMKKGNSFVASKSGPVISEIKSNNSAMFGNSTSDKNIRFNIEKLHINDKVLLISEKGIQKTIVVVKNGPLEIDYQNMNTKFIRIEIRGKEINMKDEVVKLLTNPIYF